MEFTYKTRLGKIERRFVHGIEYFIYIEDRIKRIKEGKRKLSIKTERNGTLDGEAIEENTAFFESCRERELMPIGSWFITDDRIANICNKNVDFWNGGIE